MFRLLGKVERLFLRALVWCLAAFAAAVFLGTVAWPVWCIFANGCWLYGVVK